MSEPDNFEQEFVATFLEEAKEVLSDWEKSCLDLERGADQSKIDALFRSAHNLKGSSRSVGLEAFSGLVHKAEDVISLLRSKEVSVSPEILRVLLEVHSTLVDWTQELYSNSKYTPQNIDHLKTLLSAFLQPAQQSSTPSNMSLLDTTKTSGFVSFEDEPKNLGKILIETGAATTSQVVAAARLQDRKIGEILVEQGFVKKESVEKALEIQTKKSGTGRLSESIRVPSTKIDALMQLVGELSTQQSIISYSRRQNDLGSKNCLNAIQISEKLTKDLQHQTLGLRMQSLTGLFQRLERAVRDVARDQNKSVEITMSGDDVELDKAVIERVTDTLVHIVRNAIDHGVEPAEIRKSTSKPEMANIRIEALQDASTVTIRVSDDGRGINKDKVKSKAISKGLLSANAKLTENEIYSVLFLPGFSTADKISEVSGRGVGLDVVKQAIDALGGNVKINSTEGNGSTFSITLPTSVSIVDALVVNVLQNAYVIPIHEIDEVIDVASFNVEIMTNSTPMIMLRSRAIALRNLNTYLPCNNKISTEAKNIQGKPIPAFIVEVGGHQVAFCFDDIIGQQSIVVRSLAEKIANIPGFRGSTVLANGEPAVIISPREFARQYIAKTQVIS